MRQYLFLDQLRSIPVGENAPVIAELVQPMVNLAPHVRGQLLGHAALEILLDRADTFPGDVWRDAVVEVAGDPRLNYSDTYRRWWPTLGADAEERVMSWLAIADLSAFLGLLTAFAENDPAMKRMLSSRRKLLDGLVTEGVVRRSRLFLGEDVRRFVHRLGLQQRRWDFAKLRQPREKALLFDVDFHLIEGSHNTRLWAFRRAQVMGSSIPIVGFSTTRNSQPTSPSRTRIADAVISARSTAAPPTGRSHTKACGSARFWSSWARTASASTRKRSSNRRTIASIAIGTGSGQPHDTDQGALWTFATSSASSCVACIVDSTPAGETRFETSFDSIGVNMVIDRVDLDRLDSGQGGVNATTQLVLLRMLEEQGFAQEIPDGFHVPAEAVVQLADDEASLLGLPLSYTGGFTTRVEAFTTAVIDLE